MAALLFTGAIGILLGFNGRLFSWVVGAVLIWATIFAALLVYGISQQTLSLAVISVLSYNLGLIATVGFAILTGRSVAT